MEYICTLSGLDLNTSEFDILLGCEQDISFGDQEALGISHFL